VIFINDPVAKTDYVLNPDTQSVRVMKTDRIFTVTTDRQKLPEKTLAEEHQKVFVERAMVDGQRQGEKIMIATPEGIGGGVPGTFRVGVAEGRRGNVKTESLGTQAIEGVTCEGQRTTRTIPAGTIGNERPLETTTETWISPELHVLVLKKNNDPRFGETVYRLTDIKRGEPDASLFQVPSGYSTDKAMPRRAIPLPKE